MRKQWQVTIHLGDPWQRTNSSVVLSGETLAELRAAVTFWLNDERPLAFYTRRLSGRAGIQPAGFSYRGDSHQDAPVMTDHGIDIDLEARIWRGFGTHSTGIGYTFPGMIDEFVNDLIAPEKGPEWIDQLLVDGVPAAYRVKTTKKTSEADEVNDKVRRGWTVLGFEEGVFTLVHPEENAK